MYRVVAQTRLGIVSTYLPRRCGLATYTADLREAMQSDPNDGVDPVVVAIDRDGLTYPDEVVAVIEQDSIASYVTAADDLAAAGVDAVLIQHEYGIFGGPNGSYVLHLARALTRHGIPYLVTLHTQLSNPTAGQSATLSALCAGAARVTVFTETARHLAIRAGIATGEQLTVVPHGAPEILRAVPPREDLRDHVTEVLDQLGDDPVLTTFGLVSAGKGLEDAIGALEKVVERHPNTRYVIAGATHPEIVRHEGESYRQSLHHLAKQLGLTGNVHFIDSFLTPAELSAVLGRTTIFVTPYVSSEQICSGVLTFAIAAGCPVVSTDYRYASDLLSDGAGVLVPCRDVTALAAGISGLLDSPPALAATRAAADSRGSRLTWSAVGLQAAKLIRDVVSEARARGSGRLTVPPVPVPRLRLHHLGRLTDEFGIVEFSRGSDPDLAQGYNVDDVARLAIVSAGLLALAPPAPPRVINLAQRWAAMSVRFLAAAVRTGVMHNRMSYGGSWTDAPHAGDHVGRSVWALGVLSAGAGVPPETRREARALLTGLAPDTPTLASSGLRSIAYALLGCAAAGTGPIASLVAHLDTALTRTADADWYWFEPRLTYDNARLPQALLAGAEALGVRGVAAHALTALDWYANHAGLTTGTLRNVGNRWHHRDASWDGASWADGDEQPIDAASAVEAMVEAWRHTGDPRYGSLAGVAYDWFHGRNRRGVPLYDARTGACHDGLTPDGVNLNQGAESTLAHLQAELALLQAGLAVLPDRVPVEPSADARAAIAKPERKGTLLATDRAKSKPGRRAGTRSTWKGQHDAR
jgi:glycosyltransferase involved in cell wall biosynthesis